jgi:hypothetical protein
MNDDPLSRLRAQLVRAVAIDTHGTPDRPRRHRPRMVLWSCLGVALVAVPAAGAATGVIDLSPDTTTSDGSVYRVTTITDGQSAGDPATKDGVGRECKKVNVTDAAGSERPATMSCRPRDAPADPAVVSVDFSVTASRQLFVSGSTAAGADKVVIEGIDQPVTLREPDAAGRRQFSAVIALGKYTVAAYDARGQQIGTAVAGLSERR